MGEDLPHIDLPAMGIGSVNGRAVLLMVPGASQPVDTHPLQRAGATTALRFAVGEPGRRGTVWRLWANKNSPDVYLASRQTTGQMKFSLHASGDWRQQVVRPDAPKTVEFTGRSGIEGRILNQWTRPAANAVGWTPALTIVLPHDELTRIPGDSVKWQDVRWCPRPMPGFQVEFEIHLVDPGRGLMGYGSASSAERVDVMDGLELSDGEVALVLAKTVRTHDDDRRVIDAFRQYSRQQGTTEAFDKNPLLGPRPLFSVPDTAGLPRYYDLRFRD